MLLFKRPTNVASKEVLLKTIDKDHNKTLAKSELKQYQYPLEASQGLETDIARESDIDLYLTPLGQGRQFIEACCT
jgi:hypothetical protein